MRLGGTQGYARACRQIYAYMYVYMYLCMYVLYIYIYIHRVTPDWRVAADNSRSGFGIAPLRVRLILPRDDELKLLPLKSDLVLNCALAQSLPAVSSIVGEQKEGLVMGLECGAEGRFHWQRERKREQERERESD